MLKENRELKLIFILLTLLFGIFLFYPLVLVILKSFQLGGSFTLSNFSQLILTQQFSNSLMNSFKVSGASAFVSVSLAFFFGLFYSFYKHF